MAAWTKRPKLWSTAREYVVQVLSFHPLILIKIHDSDTKLKSYFYELKMRTHFLPWILEADLVMKLCTIFKLHYNKSQAPKPATQNTSNP